MEKEIKVDEPDFRNYIATLLRDYCLSRTCEGCQFRDKNDTTCDIGYPEEWSLED